VSFGDVSGYKTPAPQTVTIIAGQTVSVEGKYVGETAVILQVYVREAGTLINWVKNAPVACMLVNGTILSDTTGNEGYAQFNLGSYTDKVTVTVEMPFLSMYYSNSTTINTLQRGTNTIYIDLPSKLPFWVAIGVAFIIIVALMVAVIIYVKRRR
jgi:hypothetical protein